MRVSVAAVARLSRAVRVPPTASQGKNMMHLLHVTVGGG
jgi:hypothetical protein